MSTFFEKTIQISKNTIFILCNIDNKCFFFLPGHKTTFSIALPFFREKYRFHKAGPAYLHGLSAWPICRAVDPGHNLRKGTFPYPILYVPRSRNRPCPLHTVAQRAAVFAEHRRSAPNKPQLKINRLPSAVEPSAGIYNVCI